MPSNLFPHLHMVLLLGMLLASNSTATKQQEDCKTHADCPMSRYCTTWGSCKSCSHCTTQFSINRQCPQDRCAEFLECRTNDDCAEKSGTTRLPPVTNSRWCGNDYKCSNCSEFCYTPQRDREYHNDGSIIEPGQLCPEDCCSWNSIPTFVNDDTKGHVKFMFGLCNSLEHDDFRAFCMTQSEIQQWDTSPFFGRTPEQAIAAGAHECTVIVDENPVGIYPRRVPIFDCKVLERRCQRDSVAIIAFSRHRGEHFILFKEKIQASTSSESCAMLEGFIQLGILIVGTIILYITVCVPWCLKQRRRTDRQHPPPPLSPSKKNQGNDKLPLLCHVLILFLLLIIVVCGLGPFILYFTPQFLVDALVSIFATW